MSKKSIDVFADKQYITQIGKEVMHFKFADGSQDSKVVSRKEIALVLPWLQSEMNFYDRMSREMREEAEKQRKAFESCYHFYTEEEMEEEEELQEEEIEETQEFEELQALDELLNAIEPQEEMEALMEKEEQKEQDE